MTRINFKTFLYALCLVFAAYSSSSQANSRFHEDDDDHRSHRSERYSYVYYPQHSAYFSPQSKRWYWQENSRWHKAHVLPAHLRINMSIGGIPISLSTPVPYREQIYIEERYPEPRYLSTKERRLIARYEREYYRHSRHHRHDRHHRRSHKHHDHDDDDD
jgi:hypothetical protein